MYDFNITSKIFTLRNVLHRLGATVTVLRERQIEADHLRTDKPLNVKYAAEFLVRKVPDDQQVKPQFSSSFF